jgi:hypothetical protein
MMPKRMITGHVNNWRCHDIAIIHDQQQQTCGVVKLLFVLLLAITAAYSVRLNALRSGNHVRDVVETQLIHILR